jgi:hypothetical protein
MRTPQGIWGDRPPVVDAHDREAAIRAHNDSGQLAHLSLLGNVAVASSEIDDADRQLALHAEAQGFLRRDIMRYLAYRQLPVWHRTAPEQRGTLADYVDEHIMHRYEQALAADWPGFEFSTEHVLKMSRPMLDRFEQTFSPEDLEYFLSESIGVLRSRTAPGPLSVVQQVSVVFSQIRTRQFVHIPKSTWGIEPLQHTFMTLGRSHLRAGALEFSRLGERAARAG